MFRNILTLYSDFLKALTKASKARITLVMLFKQYGGGELQAIIVGLFLR